MTFRTSTEAIRDYCAGGGFCEHCPFYDHEAERCVFMEVPALWDTERIREACREAGIAKEVE